MKPRSILFVISSLAAGGAERMIVELANALDQRGHRVAMLTLAASSVDHYSLRTSVQRIALNVVWDSKSIWQSLAGNFRRSLMIRRVITDISPDLVISFIDQTNVRILAASIATRVPVIVCERTDPRRHVLGQGWAIARRLLYPMAARVVVQTESVALWARRLVPAKRTYVLPNFVRSLPALPTTSAQRNRLAIVAVGRLDRPKAIDHLMAAFAQTGLAAQGGTLTVLGEGPERHSLELLRDSLQLGKAVSMPGVVADPESWLAQASLYVLPSRYEGFPNALLEAMAMGCAVIATDCDSGPRDIIQHGTNGLLVPVDDVEALSSAMRLLLSDEPMRMRLGAEAAKVRETYSREKIVLRWEQLIDEVAVP